MPRRRLDPLIPPPTASAAQQAPQPALPSSSLASHLSQSQPIDPKEQPTPRKLHKKQLTFTNKHLHFASPQKRPHFRPPLLKAFPSDNQARSTQLEADGAGGERVESFLESALEIGSASSAMAPSGKSKASDGQGERAPPVDVRDAVDREEVHSEIKMNKDAPRGKGESEGAAKTRLFSSNSKLSLDLFEIGKPLGKGQFGQVHMVRTKAKPNYILAIKCIKKKKIRALDDGKQFRREVEIQSRLLHPHLLRLYGYFHDEEQVYLMLEYAGGGELFRKLQKTTEGRFDEPTAAKYIAQVTDGLIYLHSKRIIHRDIKPENLLLSLNGDIKIADFGWSVHAPSDRRTTHCGTPIYLAPEIARGKHEVYSRAVDLWALGVLAYELLVGDPPYDSNAKPQNVANRCIEQKITSGAPPFYPAYLSKPVKLLILALLKHAPSERLPLNKVKQHPWIQRHVRVKRSEQASQASQESEGAPRRGE